MNYLRRTMAIAINKCYKNIINTNVKQKINWFICMRRVNQNEKKHTHNLEAKLNQSANNDNCFQCTESFAVNSIANRKKFPHIQWLYQQSLQMAKTIRFLLLFASLANDSLTIYLFGVYVLFFAGLFMN